MTGQSPPEITALQPGERIRTVFAATAAVPRG
jgi:hypothetical protein